MKFAKTAIAALTLAVALPAHALTITPVTSDIANTLTNALLVPNSGINVLSASYVGNSVGQAATYSGFNLVPAYGSNPTLTIDDGILLTTGSSQFPLSNTAHAYSVTTNTGGDADLTAILQAAGAPSFTVQDVNSLTLTFTVDPDVTSISASFLFGSEEFPDQNVTDIFAFIVDGVNYAKFVDGSLVSFVQGANAANFVNNGNGSTGPYGIEYDGLSLSLGISALLDPTLSVHTLKIAIADTADAIFDSGVFLANLTGGKQTSGGGICGGPNQPACEPNNPPSEVPAPATLPLLGLGLLGFLASRRRKA